MENMWQYQLWGGRRKHILWSLHVRTMLVRTKMLGQNFEGPKSPKWGFVIVKCMDVSKEKINNFHTAVVPLPAQLGTVAGRTVQTYTHTGAWSTVPCFARQLQWKNSCVEVVDFFLGCKDNPLVRSIFSWDKHSPYKWALVYLVTIVEWFIVEVFCEGKRFLYIYFCKLYDSWIMIQLS